MCQPGKRHKDLMASWRNDQKAEGEVNVANVKEALYEIVRQSIWATPNVSAQPEVLLIRWRVIEILTAGLQIERHFIGYNFKDREGRVSTAIQEMDFAARRGVTCSGRVYELIGPPGHDPDGEWVWKNWVRVNQVTNESDVTEEVMKRLLEAEAEQ